MNKMSQWSVVVCVVSLLAQTSMVEAKRQELSKGRSPQTEKQVRIAFAKIPVMVRIARCESGSASLLDEEHHSEISTQVLQVRFK